MTSGRIHNPRISRSRMKMTKTIGLNALVGIHSKSSRTTKNKFDFEGSNNIAEFVKIAHEEALWVILRPIFYSFN